MPTTIMTPEEVLRHGKRIVLFPKSKTKGRETYFIQDGRLFQQGKLFIDGQRLEVDLVDQPMYIEDVYPYIERVYSQSSKGILLARRSGSREGNKRHPLPLRKTGKGMGNTLRQAQPLEVYEQMEATQREVTRRQKQRHYQEQYS